MSYKDKATQQKFQRDLMRRRRADAAAEQKGTVINKEQQSTAAAPPLTPLTQQDPPPAAALLTPFTQQGPPAADRGTAGPQGQGKCVWSDKDICILFLSQDLKPIRCYGFIRICEGKPDDENTIPFKPCRENNDKTQQLAL